MKVVERIAGLTPRWQDYYRITAMSTTALFVRALLAVMLVTAIASSASPPRLHVGSLTTWYRQVVPLVIVGDGWSQRMILQNVDDTPSIGTISFYRQDGSPWRIELSNRGSDSVFLVNLKAGEVAQYETAVKATAQELGWAVVELQTSGLGDFFGQTLFRKQTEGRPDLMTAVPFSDDSYNGFRVFFDHTDGKYHGVGIINSSLCRFPPCRDVQIQIKVRGTDGAVVSDKTRTIRPGSLTWFSLAAEYPETIGRTGVFEVTPVDRLSAALSGFSLQFTPNGAFTAVSAFEM